MGKLDYRNASNNNVISYYITVMILINKLYTNFALPPNAQHDLGDRVYQPQAIRNRQQEQPQYDTLDGFYRRRLNELPLDDNNYNNNDSNFSTESSILDGFHFYPRVNFKPPTTSLRFSGKFRFGYDSNFWSLFRNRSRSVYANCTEYDLDNNFANNDDNYDNNTESTGIYYNCTSYFNDPILFNETEYSDFVSRDSNNNDQRKEYIVGCTWLAIFLFSLFVFWISFIIICRIKGYNKVGFLSGNPFLRPRHHNVETENQESNQNHEEQQQLPQEGQEKQQPSDDETKLKTSLSRSFTTNEAEQSALLEGNIIHANTSEWDDDGDTDCHKLPLTSSSSYDCNNSSTINPMVASTNATGNEDNDGKVIASSIECQADTKTTDDGNSTNINDCDNHYDDYRSHSVRDCEEKTMQLQAGQIVFVGDSIVKTPTSSVCSNNNTPDTDGNVNNHFGYTLAENEETTKQIQGQHVMFGNDSTVATSSSSANNTPTPSECIELGMIEYVSCFNIDIVLWIRGIFVLSGLVFIIFSILLVTRGFRNLQGTLDTTNYAAVKVAHLFTEAYDIINDTVIHVFDNTSIIQDVLLDELGKIVNGTFCPGQPNITTHNVTEVIQNLSQAVSNELEQLNLDILSHDLSGLMRSLQRSIHDFKSLSNITNSINISGWPSTLILVFCIVIPILLMSFTILSHYEKHTIKIFHSSIVYIIYPLFIMLVAISMITCIGTTVAANANSDFCYPQQYNKHDQATLVQDIIPYHALPLHIDDDFTLLNPPDVTILESLLARGKSSNSTDFQLAAFYVTQCATQNPFSFLVSFIPILTELSSLIDQLYFSLQDDALLMRWEQYCERDYGILTTTILIILSDIRSLRDSAIQLLNLVRCEEIVPIYQYLAYEAGCDYSITAVVWIFSSSLIMSVFGLLMITFRSALFPIRYK